MDERSAPEDPRSPLERLSELTPTQRKRELTREARKHGLTVTQLKARLQTSWRFVGRPKQQPPDWLWTFWFLMAGRGFGKTITGAQWTKDRMLADRVRWALVAPTRTDVRSTMVEGETGLLSILPAEALYGQSREYAWNKTLLELKLANESVATGFSSEVPDRLRGPQHHGAWLEEVSSFDDAAKGNAKETTFSNVTLGLRLGEHPQAVLTSTPKTNKLTRDVLALPKLALVTGSSHENRANLSDSWWETVIVPLLGTTTGRQEIEAILLEDVEGALWTRQVIEAGRVAAAPPLSQILVGVDPNTSSGESANDAGVVVTGKGQSDNHGYVLADRTVVRGGPAVWARASVDAYHEFDADLVVAEANNGGEMVRMVIKACDPSVPVKIVHASRGKRPRAEPVATLYERKEEGTDTPAPAVHHVGAFPELEDEMVTWTPDEDSPNRMDALVWAITEHGIWTPRRKPLRTTVPKGRIGSVGIAPAV